MTKSVATRSRTLGASHIDLDQWSAPGMHKEINFIPCSSRQALHRAKAKRRTRYETSDQTSAQAVFDDTRCNTGLGQSAGRREGRRANPVNAGDRSKESGGSTATAQP